MSRKLPFGTPPSVAALPYTTGDYYFVHSVTGSNGNTGKKPEKPFATVQKAIDSCTASKHDVVVLMPGHVETVTATNIAHNKAGVQVVGLGIGLSRPTFTYGAAAATITVSAANGSWKNCVFIANFADVAAAFTIGAAKDFHITDSHFKDTSAILNFLSIVVTGATANAADGLKVQNNYFLGLATAPNAFVSVLGNLDHLQLLDNYVDMAATNDVGHFLTIAALVIRGARIFRNQLNVVGATNAAVGIFITGSSTTNTGMVMLNYVTSLDTTTALLITAAINLAVHQNYLSGVVAGSGTLFPAADNPA